MNFPYFRHGILGFNYADAMKEEINKKRAINGKLVHDTVLSIKKRLIGVGLL